MSKTGGIPDAWDDDWEVAADRPEPQTTVPAEASSKVSKSQRRAQHLEQQKQLWHAAENPDRLHWLEAQGVVPLAKPEYKPQVQLLSRRPVVAKRDAAVNGVAGLSLKDGEDDDDSGDESRRKRELELEERQRRAKAEREEKQRRYAEARQRILGGGSGGVASPSSTSSPGATPAARNGSQGREGRRQRGSRMNGGNPGSHSASSADQSPARTAAGGDRQLFDPNDMGQRLPGRETPVGALEDQPLRQPRGPDKSGRGGFGFTGRGGRAQG